MQSALPYCAVYPHYYDGRYIAGAESLWPVFVGIADPAVAGGVYFQKAAGQICVEYMRTNDDKGG